jgi:hypothetical protein
LQTVQATQSPETSAGGRLPHLPMLEHDNSSRSTSSTYSTYPSSIYPLDVHHYAPYPTAPQPIRLPSDQIQRIIDALNPPKPVAVSTTRNHP